MRDEALTIAVVAAFALLVTVHLAIFYALVRRRHIAEGFGGLLALPAAPWLAFRNGMPALAILWIVSAALYAVAFVLAR